MLIIFDLDDTLIETSEYITPYKLKIALSRMVQEGLCVYDFEKALEVLLRLNLTAESAKSALEEFLEIHEFDSKFLEIGVRELYHIFSEETPVFPIEGALQVLFELSLKNKLALVSVGNPEFQLFKLKKAGIDSSFFCKILISEERNKKKQYDLLMQEWNLASHEVVVCGDRISIDLAPAKQLGVSTIHMKRGRGMYSQDSGNEVDFTITKLSQIPKILSTISNRMSLNS